MSHDVSSPMIMQLLHLWSNRTGEERKKI